MRSVFLQSIPPSDNPDFDRLFDIFKQLLVYTSGDVSEAISWMTELDKQYDLTSDNYGMADFIEDLKQKGYLQENHSGQSGISGLSISDRMEQEIRKDALDEIFGKLNKGGGGKHTTNFTGKGEERLPETKAFQFGDRLDALAITESLKNALKRNTDGSFQMAESDLEIHDTSYQTNTSTVLMIDISHSMILYGEDRITPAKKVAMALAELIRTRYQKDTLDLIVFGNDAWPVKLKDLPYLQVGPYHTNTVAGLELAMDILRRKKGNNKQIFMITDGKPTCIKQGKKYYKNSFGLDKKILSRTLALSAQCKRMNIPITTFMVTREPYLQAFVEKFTEVNQGSAFYTGLENLGELVFQDFNKKKRLR